MSQKLCPGSNGTTLGTYQDFTITCGVDLPGADIRRTNAADFKSCTDLCSGSHPKCFAVTYDASKKHGSDNCYLKAGVPSPFVNPDFDSAILVEDPNAPKPVADCSRLGETIEEGGLVFHKFCGKDYTFNDLSFVPALSLADCIKECATYSGAALPCRGVVYDPAAKYGYFNCYLKSGFDKSLQITNTILSVDSAFQIADKETGSPVPGSSTADPGSKTTDPGGSSPAGNSGRPSSVVIGGAIGGSLAGLAVLVLIGVFFYWRRRRRLSEAAPPLYDESAYKMGPPMPPGELNANTGHYFTNELESPQSPSELEAKQSTLELQGSPTGHLRF